MPRSTSAPSSPSRWRQAGIPPTPMSWSGPRAALSSARSSAPARSRSRPSSARPGAARSWRTPLEAGSIEKHGPGACSDGFDTASCPGLRRPGLQLVLGSPAPYTTEGIEEWIEDHIGARANGWPSRPTIVAAFHLETRERVAFGTEGSPDIPIKRAAAASSAVPMLYEPVIIDGGRYIDGGITSGTNADLLLGSDEPLDLIIVIAPDGLARKLGKGRGYMRASSIVLAPLPWVARSTRSTAPGRIPRSSCYDRTRAFSTRPGQIR